MRYKETRSANSSLLFGPGPAESLCVGCRYGPKNDNGTEREAFFR